MKSRCCKTKNKYKVDDDDDNYLEKTNENDYTDYPKLNSLTQIEKE